jgi:hypothetical protein
MGAAGGSRDQGRGSVRRGLSPALAVLSGCTARGFPRDLPGDADLQLVRRAARDAEALDAAGRSLAGVPLMYYGADEPSGAVFTARFGGIPLRRHTTRPIIDGPWPTRRGRQLTTPLTAGICELCESYDGITVHHGRRLTDLNRYSSTGTPPTGRGDADQTTEDPDRLRLLPRRDASGADPAVAPLESRMRGNSHVRCGGRSREKGQLTAGTSPCYG